MFRLLQRLSVNTLRNLFGSGQTSFNVEKKLIEYNPTISSTQVSNNNNQISNNTRRYYGTEDEFPFVRKKNDLHTSFLSFAHVFLHTSLETIKLC